MIADARNLCRSRPVINDAFIRRTIPLAGRDATPRTVVWQASQLRQSRSAGIEDSRHPGTGNATGRAKALELHRSLMAVPWRGTRQRTVFEGATVAGSGQATWGLNDATKHRTPYPVKAWH